MAAAADAGPTPLVKKRTLVLRRKVTPASVCTPKEPEDCVALGTQIEYGGKGFTKDPAKAAAYYRIACDAEDTGGCTTLADMYERGKGVAKDDAEAMRLRRHACRLGECMSLGFELVDADDRALRDEGLAIFAAICDGDGYEDDIGIACHMRGDRARTYAEGAPWIKKSCAAQYIRGCEKLAQLYFNDEYPGASAKAATRALEQMCERQFAMACDLVAHRHFEGKGAPASRTEADRWMQKGCDAGGEHLCEALERRRRMGDF